MTEHEFRALAEKIRAYMVNEERETSLAWLIDILKRVWLDGSEYSDDKMVEEIMNNE